MPPLALTLGDPAGIGPELALAAWLGRGGRDPLPPFFLVADPDFVERTAHRLGLSVPVAEIDPETAIEVFPRALPVVALPTGTTIEAKAGAPDSASAGATIESITAAVGFVRAGRASAVVTNPIAKFVLTKAGFAHPGHTEFLAALSVPPGRDPPRPVMMIWSDELAVVPVTIHVALRRVPDLLTQDLVEETARIVARDLAERFGIAAPRLVLAGLNPHAGEAGTMGLEDRD
ncbi:4-hydroxythreonine-4-phosphate dehydrogenase PdxA, partial [Methylobacterium trifolii]